MVSLSDYAVCVPGDPQRNRLRDAMVLWRSIVVRRRRLDLLTEQANPLLREANIIVYMNKCDLLRKLIASGRHPLEQAFPEFADYATYQTARAAPRVDGLTGKTSSFTDPTSPYELARRFIRSKFEVRRVGRIPLTAQNINRRETRPGNVSWHWLTAIDARVTRMTLASVHDLIFKRQLVEGGVL